MQRGRVLYDQTGDVIEGHFFLVRLGTELFRMSRRPFVQTGVGRTRYPCEANVWRAGKHRVYACPFDATHKTYAREMVEDVILDTHWHGETVLSTPSTPILTQDAAERLMGAELAGVSCDEVSITTQGLAAEGLRWFAVHVRSPAPYRLPYCDPPEANVCTNCGHAPIVCPGCGISNFWGCIKCKRFGVMEPISAAREIDDYLLLQWPRATEYDLIDPRRWEGSDFNSPGPFIVVTAKGLQALLDSDVWPLTAWPLRTLVSGVPQDVLDCLPPVHPDFDGQVKTVDPQNIEADLGSLRRA